MGKRSVLRLAAIAVGLLIVAATVAGPALGRAALPAVARARFAIGSETRTAGTAFFLAAPVEAGAVGVTTAHSFDPTELAAASEVIFELGRTPRRVARSSRFLAAPGRAFTEKGGTLRGDYLVFALDDGPRDVRVLEADDAPARRGLRVRMLGVPSSIPQDEDDVWGRVNEVADDALEVQLDVPADLRGWGGAPVLNAENGKVIGMLQAAWSDEGGIRLGVSPIEGVLEALTRPLAGGLGEPFAKRLARSNGSNGATQGAGLPESAAPVAVPREATRRAKEREDPDRALLGRAGAVDARILVEIEYPPDQSVMGDPEGAFIAGRALAMLGEFRRFDVVLVIDTSGSTKQMSGADINGNGVVGQDRLSGIFGATDSGDSILAAEVAAARRILRGLDPRNTRVALVSFSGTRGGNTGGIFQSRPPAPAITEEPLTTEYERIEKALDRVLDRGAKGLTWMSAAVDQATVELLGLRGGRSRPDPRSEKVVLFLTDGVPTLPHDSVYVADNVRAVLRAADRAGRAGVVIHAFAIGPEALEGPVATVEMAERTGGYFTPVRHPGDLVEVIENVSFANLEELTVRNLTTDQPASELLTNADGSWGALVPLEVGKNRIEVAARATDGRAARAEVLVQYAPGAPAPDVPRTLLVRRNRLLEQRLVELKRERIAQEREQAEEARKELVIQIEEERDAAREKAAQQRKELDLERERGKE